ncbi:MAG: phenylalanine--tRNA ligase subunit beta [Schwartzia sp.]|nr:phenylalanine--tRNA ligase subunit beta [Schwartzia sp. (in: firmicutes)]
MQVSIQWLKDYIDFDETPEQLADLLTMAGVPVENVRRADEGLDKVVTGKLTEVVPHPNSDHLQVCTVDVGGKEPLTIVTGAPNVKQGQVVPVALVGAHLPNGQKISKGKLRGIVSMGMLCSADELKMDLANLPEEQKTGIYILTDDTEAGQSAAKALGLDDCVLEFELTANRGDCFSVFGIVREIAVLTGKKPHWPEIAVKENDDARAADMVKIAIDATDLCARFSARVLKNVKIGPSPEWMQKRLEGAGIRAINNVVDVTNFVMVELGQPMHAYDYDEVKGHSLTARRAVEGENVHTLDDSSRLAKGGELVIADAEKPAGLAGVMGGLETEITEKTTTVVLEAASFNGSSIRRTSRAIGLHSEASGRFERGVDATGTVRALDRAAQLLEDMGACTVAKGVVDVYPVKKEPTAVAFTAAEVNGRLGTEISGAKMKEIIEKLGFSVEETGAEAYRAAVPSWRGDVSCMEDISEEVARIYGFDHIPSTTPRGDVMEARQSASQAFAAKIRRVLVSLGMDEARSFAFTHPLMFDRLNVPEDSPLRCAIPIMNPLTDEYPLVRTTLLTNLFENTVRNLSRKNEDIRLFEIAPVFLPKALPVTEQPDEILKLAGLLTGRREPVGWGQDGAAIDFYDAKGIVEQLLEALSIFRCTVEPGEHFALHPGATAVFKKGKEVLAVVGEVHPAVQEAFGVTKKMYVFEMDVATLLRNTAKDFTSQTLPKYPGVSRDLAMIVSLDTAAADVERLIKKNAGPYFKDVTLFDLYKGQQVGEGRKSLAFALRFQSGEKTLTDEEVDTAMEKIVAAAKKEFGAELRM